MALTVLQQRLSQGALTLADTASGYRLQIANDFSPLIQQVFPSVKTWSSAIRNVKCDCLQTTGDAWRYWANSWRDCIEQYFYGNYLIKAGLLSKAFRDTLGRPALLHTTPAFLAAFGLKSLQDLPKLPDVQQRDIKSCRLGSFLKTLFKDPHQQCIKASVEQGRPLVDIRQVSVQYHTNSIIRQWWG